MLQLGPVVRIDRLAFDDMEVGAFLILISESKLVNTIK